MREEEWGTRSSSVPIMHIDLLQDTAGTVLLSLVTQCATAPGGAQRKGRCGMSDMV